MTTVLRGRIWTGHGFVEEIAVDGGLVVPVPPRPEQIVDLGDRLLTPGFVDAHVHTVHTGFQLSGIDLFGVASLAELLDRLRDEARAKPDGVLVGSGWEDTDWPEGRAPTADDLERVAPGRRIFLGRIEGHSAVISDALAVDVPGLSGLAGHYADGWVEREAKIAVADVLAVKVGADERLEAARTAVRHYARVGIAAFHENGAQHIGPDYELALVRQAAGEAGLVPTLYWGELDGFGDVERLGIAGLAGDLNADGAIGSRTAALRSPYDDEPHSCGHPILDAEQIATHLIRCTEAGIQGGFHCIGDAALDTMARGITLAGERVGLDDLARARHRIEHVEMPTPELLDIMASHGITASVQPMFDAQWGGPGGFYAARLGDRWKTMNPFGSMHRAGVRMAFGSDTPVTPIEPWQAVRAAVNHLGPGEAIDTATALAAHTLGGWHAAGIDEPGLVPGGRATYALWDLPAGLAADGLPVLEPDQPLPTLVTLVVDGRSVVEER